MKHITHDTIKKLIEIKKTLGLYGEAGSGKSYLLEQIANELGIPFYGFTCGPTTRYDDIIGYNDIHGTGISSALGNMCEQPGIFSFEEIDLLNAKVQNQLNDLLQAKRLKNHKGEIKQFHPNFLIIATANTRGDGNVGQYVTRTTADKSLASRFLHYEINIDPQIEFEMSGKNIILHNLMKSIRHEINELNSDLIITPRQTKDIADLLTVMAPIDIAQEGFLKLPNFMEIRQNENVEKGYKKFLKLQSSVTPIFIMEKEQQEEQEKEEEQQNSDQSKGNHDDYHQNHGSQAKSSTDDNEEPNDKTTNDQTTRNKNINIKNAIKHHDIVSDLLKDIKGKYQIKKITD